MKLFFLITFSIPFFCFAQKLKIDVIQATGDTLYSSELQSIGGFGSLQLSIFKTKDEMKLEFIKLVNSGDRFSVAKGASAYLTTINGMVDTLFAINSTEPDLLAEGYTITDNNNRVQGRSSIWSFVPTYLLTDKDVRLLSQEPIKSIEMVTNKGIKKYSVKERKSTLIADTLKLFP